MKSKMWTNSVLILCLLYPVCGWKLIYRCTFALRTGTVSSMPVTCAIVRWFYYMALQLDPRNRSWMWDFSSTVLSYFLLFVLVLVLPCSCKQRQLNHFWSKYMVNNIWNWQLGSRGSSTSSPWVASIHKNNSSFRHVSKCEVQCFSLTEAILENSWEQSLTNKLVCCSESIFCDACAGLNQKNSTLFVFTVMKEYVSTATVVFTDEYKRVTYIRFSV